MQLQKVIQVASGIFLLTNDCVNPQKPCLYISRRLFVRLESQSRTGGEVLWICFRRSRHHLPSKENPDCCMCVGKNAFQFVFLRPWAEICHQSRCFLCCSKYSSRWFWVIQNEISSIQYLTKLTRAEGTSTFWRCNVHNAGKDTHKAMCRKQCNCLKLFPVALDFLHGAKRN